MTILLVVCPVVAALLMLLLMPRFLPILKKMKFGQTIYKLGPKTHQIKEGTPNMGGILIGGITILVGIAALALGNGAGSWSNTLALLFVSLGSMMIGFADDYIKDVKKHHEGLKPRQKIAGQIVIGLLFSWYCYINVGSGIAIPFSAAYWDLGIFYIPIMTLLVIFITNSANLQDGVDGLLSSVNIIGMAAWGMIALALPATIFSDGNSPRYLAIFSFSLLGACLGFLFFNRHPAKVFMGDTGSMFIGGTMVGVAMLLKQEFLLIPICFTSILSSVSVIMQVAYFKITHGKRIFKMAPIHHHFELGGMSENRIVLMYSGITVVLSVLAVLSAC